MAEISIIIPAYNVAEYLPRALDSILKQTLADYEVILVDDGSTDDTRNICDDYARRDGRICAIHQQNAGAPAARNAAIERAGGKYLYFMDGDDWAEPDMLRDMYDIAENSGAELVVAGFYIDTGYGSGKYWTQTNSADDAVYESAEAFRRASAPLFDKNLLYTPWNKLYLAERVKRLGIRFRNVKWDDFPFNLDYLRDVERVAVTHRAYYHFMRERRESETAKYYPQMFEKREEEHGWMTELYAYWGLESDAAVQEFLARRYIERIFGVVENVTCAACPLGGREKRREIARILGAPGVARELPRMKPRSTMMRLMLVPLRMRSVFLTYLLGCVMSFVRRRLSGIFARLKAVR